jgi:hypothetical protein
LAGMAVLHERGVRPPIAAETIALIRQMATDNRTWGAERIRGELLKLHIHVARRPPSYLSSSSLKTNGWTNRPGQQPQRMIVGGIFIPFLRDIVHATIADPLLRP